MELGQPLPFIRDDTIEYVIVIALELNNNVFITVPIIIVFVNWWEHLIIGALDMAEYNTGAIAFCETSEGITYHIRKHDFQIIQ